MKNVNLNAGGLIGAILAAAIVAGVMLSWGGNPPRLLSRVFVFAVIAGAVGGTWIWGKLFPGSLPAVEELPERTTMAYLKTALPKRVFRVSGLLRWLLSFTLLPLGALLILLGVAAVFSSDVENRGVAVLVTFGVGAAFLLAWLWVFRLKLEIGDDAFRLTGLLGTKKVPFSDVAGYSIESRGVAQAIKLLDGAGRCLGRIHSHLAGFSSVVSWVEQTFTPRGGAAKST